MLKKKILLSGFEPFGGLSTNPTMDIIKKSQDWELPNVELHTIILPVVYNDCAEKLIMEIERIQPDIVVSLGVAVGRAAITPERIGINIQDTVGEGKSGDNSGFRPKDQKIEEEGPDGLFSTLPIREIVEHLLEKGIPAEISNTAGTYICNNTLYSVLYYIYQKNLPIRAGFIHVPATPEMMVNKPQSPSMSIEYQARGIESILQYLS